MSNQIRLLVGLANPGPEYARTRHNAGAWVVEELARVHNINLREESKYYGLTGRIMANGQDLRLLIPTTFMNLSGKSVAALANFYQIKPEEILVAHDELDLPPGVAKFKKGGGHGGHNGLRDIISKMGNNKDFYRLRVGIGHPATRIKSPILFWVKRLLKSKNVSMLRPMKPYVAWTSYSKMGSIKHRTDYIHSKQSRIF